MKQTRRLYLHPPLERIWHAVHTICILALIVSGVFLRWPELGGQNYRIPVLIHNHFGALLIVDYVLWVFYLFASGRLTHYLPRGRDLLGGLVAQGLFYGLEVFRGGSHPYEVTEKEKFNPLQKWAYIAVMFGLVPLLCLSGLVLLLPGSFPGLIARVGLGVISTFHAALAFLATAFLINHVYMATMGSSPLEAFRSMVTGWSNEEVHGEGEEKSEETPG
jgi:thiosulfate reductase cytochrome b subunit